jgi:hypothetical protein
MPFTARNPARFDGGLLALCILLGVLAFSGGSSRNGEPGQLVAQLAAVAAGLGAVIARVFQGGRSLRAPFWFLGALTALMIVQLVPLPPRLWSALPGRAIFVGLGERAGVSGVWRPISLSPDATLAALFGMLPSFAALIAVATVPRDRVWWIVHAVAGCIALSVAIGLAQMIMGGTGPLYFYRVTNLHVATGIFANRNHAGLFVALGLPLIGAVIARSHAVDRRPASATALIVAAVASVMLILALVATGSRAGLLVGGLGVVSGVALAWSGLRATAMGWRTGSTNGLPRRVGLGLTILVLTVLAGVLATSNGESFSRLRSLDVASDGRAVLFWPNVALARGYFPVGAGFGTFSQVFRIAEPFDNLSLSYLNHAHNDWLEIVAEGGLMAIVIALAFVWWLARSVATIRRVQDVGMRVLGWLGVIWLAMIAVASAFDYPLRTPLVAVTWVIAMACVVIAAAGRPLTISSA